jgi:hypothetical protein
MNTTAKLATVLDHDLFSDRRRVTRVFRGLEDVWYYVKGDTGRSMCSRPAQNSKLFCEQKLFQHMGFWSMDTLEV